MILKRSTTLIVTLILTACLTMTATAGTSENNPPTIDFWDLLTMFMIAESASVLDWRTGNEADSPIHWKTPGVKWDKRHRSYARRGEVVVTVNGKPSYHLERYVTPSAWAIELLGSRTGVTEVVLRTMSPGDPDLENAANHGVQLELLKCDPVLAATTGAQLYRIKVPGKRSAYLLHTWSCGSGGCWSNLSLFLIKEAADLVTDLVTNCDRDKCLDYGAKRVSLGGEIRQEDSPHDQKEDDLHEATKAWILRAARPFCVANSRPAHRFELMLTSDQVAQCKNLNHRDAIVIGKLVPPDAESGFPYEKIQVHEIRPFGGDYGDSKRNYGLAEGNVEGKP